MNKVKIKDKTFEIKFTEAELLAHIDKVAERLNADMADKLPLFVVILNGAFMFASDLMKRITIPCEISFVKCASYNGTTSTGVVKRLIGLDGDLTGRTVVVVEDIVESGLTMTEMLKYLKTLNPAEVHVCSLFVKPELLKMPLDIEYKVLEISNDFIVGYGLDYDFQGRNLKDLYVLSSEEQ